MLTAVTAAPPDVSEKTPPDELEVRLTVAAAVVGLPKASCSWTVILPRVGEFEAVPDTAVDVKTSLAGGAMVTVTDAFDVGVTPEFESTALIT